MTQEVRYIWFRKENNDFSVSYRPEAHSMAENKFSARKDWGKNEHEMASVIFNSLHKSMAQLK